MPEETTGIRNKNYLNVKNNPKNPWQGSLGNDERGHTRFRAPEYGLRAAIVLLRTYWFSYNLRTASAIIARWVPASDTIGSRANAPQNDPAGYAQFVAKRMRVGVMEDLQLFHPDRRLNHVRNLQALIEAMAEMENYAGFDVPDVEFMQALALLEPDRAPETPGGPPPAPTPPAPVADDGTIEVRRALPVGGFEVSDAVLRRLMAVNAFPIPEGASMILFGLRGCVPARPGEHGFAIGQVLKFAGLNYQNPRCTLGQWKLDEGTVAVFPGSTIPTAKYVKSSVAKGGEETNQLFTGYYAFTPGDHRAGKPSGHKAFRQEGRRIYLRTADDAEYEADSDRPEIGNPGDNLHAAFGEGLDGTYSSAGCQVVLGFPKSQAHKDSGPWPTFREGAYATKQASFRYLLLDAAEVAEISEDVKAGRPLKLRCGSHESALAAEHAPFLKAAQRALSMTDDGDFGATSALAALKFQRSASDRRVADGVLGPQTAAALKIENWPSAI